MQLNKVKNIVETRTGEAHGVSGGWFQQQPVPVVPNEKSSIGIIVHNYAGANDKHGECSRAVPSAPDMAQNHQKRSEFNIRQNKPFAYEDLHGILGLRRIDSDDYEFGLAKRHPIEGENGASVDKTRYWKEAGGSGRGSRETVGKANVDHTSLGPTGPSIYARERSYLNHPGGSAILDGSPSGKLKFLCSFGGKFIPRPGDGKHRYVGGQTHIISIREDLSWKELKEKTLGICKQPHTIKYQLPGEDFDSLISVSSDEDLLNMIEEYHGLDRLGGSQRLRIYLISLHESENLSPLDASTSQQASPDYQYVVAVNSNSTALCNSNEQCLVTEVNQTGDHLGQNPNFHKNPSSLDPSNIRTGVNALRPTQLLNEHQKIFTPPYQPQPFSPLPIEQGDCGNVNLQLPECNSCHGNSEINSSFNAPQLLPDNLCMNKESNTSVSGYHLHVQGAVKLMDSHIDYKPFDVSHLNNRNLSQEYVASVAFNENNNDFDGYSCEKATIKEMAFHSENPSSHPEDLMNLISGSNGISGSQHGMPHAFSDSQLQQQEGKSIYYSLEGASPSSSLGFTNAPSSSFLVPKAYEGKQVQLHGNIDSLSPQTDRLVDMDSSGLQNRLDLLNLMSEPINGVNVMSDKKFEETTESIHGPPFHQSSKVVESSSSCQAVEPKIKFPDVSNANSLASFGLSTSKEELQVCRGLFSSSSINLEPSADTQKSILNEAAAPYGNGNNQKYGSNAPWTRSDEISGRYPSPIRQSHDDSLGLQTVMGQKVMNFQLPEVISSGDLCSPAVCDDAVLTSNLQMRVTTDLYKNPIKDETHRREISLIDDNFQYYTDQKIEKSALADCACENSSGSLDIRGERNQLKSSVIIEDITNCFAPGIRLLPTVIPHAVAPGSATKAEIISSSPTQLDNNIPETDSEVYKTDRDEFISDATIAEMEAGGYGLQIIKNADLEELQELGSGTYGTVYHGKWRGTDVAIKRIKNSCFAGISSEQERLTKDFWREAHILSNLHHPNVVAFYGVVPDGVGGTLATVTEFMVNGSLKNVLLKKDRSLDRRRKLLIVMDAAFGMEYLHSKNIVHFDLKCDNLLVNLRDPQRPICKVADFGLSRIKRNTLVSGGVRGTLPWMAPELLNGSSNRVSEKVDVFSFGIAMWEILTGEEPYANMHYGAIIGGILKNTLRPPIPEFCDPDWRKLMTHCWSPDPEFRPSFTEITHKLRYMSTALPSKRIE